VRGPESDAKHGCHVNVQVSGGGGGLDVDIHITYRNGLFYQNLIPTEGIVDADNMALSVASDAMKAFLNATRGANGDTIYTWFYDNVLPRLQALMDLP
jgi:hypothetical protein